MKKQLLAAALAVAMTSGAIAQNATVYGIVDMGYSSSQADKTGTAGTLKNTDKSGFNAAASPLSSSRLGFTGTEDLGGGLKAGFTLEYGLGADTSAMDFATARTATVGVSGAFGSFTLGRHLTGIHSVISGYNSIAGNNMVGDVLYSGAYRMHGASGTVRGATFAAADSSNTQDTTRHNNMLAFVTPAMNGFSARVDLAMDKNNTDTGTANSGTKTDVFGLSANYAAGPVKASVGQHRAKTKLALVTGVDAVYNVFTQNNIIVQGTAATNGYFLSNSTATACTAYTTAQICQVTTAAVTAVTGANDERKDDISAASFAYDIANIGTVDLTWAKRKSWKEGTGDVLDTDGYRLGLSMPVRANMLLVARWGKSDVKSGTNLADTAERTATQLGVTYAMSKRTTGYALYGVQTQDQQANSYEEKQYAIGVRHSF